MGAKQSKRSVDISGKEAESAGEVAVAGAGGEGRVEAIADADALKPQLNGDAHIQTPEITDKEKQLDSGTPENEKDATTEKENKVEQKDEKESSPATNGENEPKEENGESVPTPEEGKKPKKEKVKKKWSLRSISFSRKDKPKQEKKSKEEEPKTNGEPEKVPEEAAEATPEAVENKITEEVKTEAEVKEEKTPETPVTEPLTNGSSTPESPKVETLATDEPAIAPEVAQPQEAATTETKPEQLPVNGLSLEEPKKEAPQAAVAEESKPEESTPVPTETVPVPEIPVKTEVCDAKMPLIEPTPPPLPANPPPSSVASFAATTMAPELIEASLANTTENAILTPPAIPDTKADTPDENETESQTTIITNTDLAISQLSPPLKETVPDEIPNVTSTTEVKIEAEPDSESNVNVPEIEPVNPNLESVAEKEMTKPEEQSLNNENINDTIKVDPENVKDPEVIIAETGTEVQQEQKEVSESQNVANVSNKSSANGNQPEDAQNVTVDEVSAIEQKEPSIDTCVEKNNLSPEPTSDIIDELLPPPPSLVEIDNIIQRDNNVIDGTDVTKTASKEIIINANHNVPHGIINENDLSRIENLKKDALGNIINAIECNGNAVSEESVVQEGSNEAHATDSAEEACNGKATTPEDSLPPSLSEAPAGASDASDASDSLPPPPSDCAAPDDDSHSLQESLPIADKIADLIPEIPTVPELNTETETSSAVAAAD